MANRVKNRILQFSNVLEMIVAVILIITIALASFSLLVELKLLIFSENTLDEFNNFLALALNLVVGIEFIKMLCKHTPETVVEVLLFAIARQLIVGHTSITDTLIGVIAIAILFMINRFVVIRKDSIKEID